MHIAPRQPLPFSISVRIGGRKMTLTWRARRRLPALLRGLLTRAWLTLSGAALAGAALAGNVLPNGHTLVAGQASVTQTGNRLDITQTTAKAILNWDSFNIGNQASVRFIQPNGDAVALNRVLSNDPSTLLGQLSANGKVWLINPAGILVGQGARIDVAGLVASTLAVRDEDFLAGRLHFAAPAGAAPGTVRNLGQIGTPAGGSVYLIGASVDNQGLISAPGGEVLLAAGQRVRLVDSATPGVAIEVTGTDGNVTNLGQILSAAGRIGLAAALVRNDGIIDASSVVAEGGRIFLRAGRALDTGAGSRIAADGASGGQVTLNADDAARIDGVVSALGSQGGGGFVETSGKRTLWLAAAPQTGAGGRWLIDPENLTIQARNADTSSIGSVVTTGMIETALNAGTSISVTTGGGTGSGQAGDITLADPISKTAGADATLSLSARHDIHVNQSLRSSSGKLNLTLTANTDGGSGGAVDIGSALNLNGGELRVAAPLLLRGATLDGLGTLVMSKSDAVEFGAGVNTVNTDLSLASVTLSGGTLRGRGKLSADNLSWTGGSIAGDLTDPAYDIKNLTLSGVATLDGRTLNLSGGASSMNLTSLSLRNSATLNNAGTLRLSNALLGVDGNGAGASVINNDGVINSGGDASVSLIGGGVDASNGVAFNNRGTVNVGTGILALGGNGSHSGAFHVVADNAGSASRLNFGAAYYPEAHAAVQTLSATASVSESGNGSAMVEFGGSSVDPQRVITNLDAPLTLRYVTLSGGTLQGAGKLSATNLIWFGGVIKGKPNGADAPWDITNLALLGAATLDGRALNLSANGQSLMSGANLTLLNSAAVNNAGLLTLSNAQLGTGGAGAGASVVNNSGAIVTDYSVASTSASSTAVQTGTGGSEPPPAILTSAIGGVHDADNRVTFRNSGVVLVTQASLRLAGDAGNDGRIDVAAGTTLSTGAANLINNSGGTLSGSGVIDVGGATLINRGLIQPGTDGAPGTLSLNGNFEQVAGGRLAVRLGGAGAGQFDRLDVSGTIKLGGALTASLSGAYTPASGDVLPFLSGRGARSGTFDSVDAPAGLQLGYSLFDGEAARLSWVDTAPGGAARYFDNGAGDFKWDRASNWSGDKLPGALDDVVIDAGFAVLHGAGADSIHDLALKPGNALNLSGGSLLVSGATSVGGALGVGTGAALTVLGPLTGAGRLSVAGGAVTLKGGASIAALDLSGGRLDGAGRLDVGHQFTRAGGTLGTSFDALSIKQDSGTLAPGPLAAAGPVSLTALNGALTLDSISASSISGRAGGGDITLATGAALTASGAGNGVVLDAGAGHFINQGGPAAIQAAGRYLIYTAGPDGDSLGGIDVRPVFGHDFASYAPQDVRQSGNRILYRDAGAPYLVRVDSLSRVYGDANPAFSYTLAPAMPGDTISGLPLLGSEAGRASPVGAYAISGGAGDLVSDYNLRFAFAPAALTVAPRPLNVSVSASKVYDGNTVFTAPQLSVSNLVNGDSVIATAAFANSEDKQAGTHKPLRAGGIALSGAASGNYSVAAGVATGAGDIAPRPVTVLGLTASDKVYDGGVLAGLGGGALDGLVAGDSVIIDSRGAFADRNAGTNKVVSVTGVTLAGADAGNYRVSALPSSLSASITPKPLATWVGGASGLWSESANWDGGAVPDGANVIAVALPGDGGSVLYDATLVPTTLASLDSHKSLVIGGGHLTLGAGAALIHDGATLELRDGARLSVAGRLSAANYVQSGGTLDGAGTLTIGNSFQQSAGRIALGSTGSAAITQATGDLSLASLSAPAVSLAAPTGAITQTGPLLTLALTTRSASGTTLDDAGNRVASFGAINSGSGAITLRSTSKPDRITLNDLSNQSGAIAIDNTGAIVSAGTLNAAAGVTLVAHSPITVEAPIVAGGDITLRAQASGGGDAIVVNSTLRSNGGNINLDAATDVTLGARASLTVAAGAAIRLTAASGHVTLLPGASVNTSPVIAEGTQQQPTINLPAEVQLQAISKPLTLTPAALLPILIPVSSVAESNKLVLAGQTIGASADSFGGAAAAAGSGSDEQSKAASDDGAATPGPASGKGPTTAKTARKTPPACN